MTGLRKNAFEVKWRVENVNSWLQTRNDTLYSPQFLAETLMNTRWKLSLSTNRQFAEECLSLTVQRDVEDNGPELIALKYELSFMACDESRIISKSYKSKFSLKTVGHELNVKQVEILYSKKEIYSPEGLYEKKEIYLPEGALTVCCKFWYAWSTVQKGGQCSIRSVIGRKCITLDGAMDHFGTLEGNVTVNFMSPSSEITFISLNACKSRGSFVTFERNEVECKCFRSYSCKLFVLGDRGQQIPLCDSSRLGNLLSSCTPVSFQCNYYWCDLNTTDFLRNGALKFQLEITYYPGVESESIEYDVNNHKKVVDEPADLETVNTPESKIPDDRFSSEDKETESSDEDECLDTAGKRHLPSTTLKNDLTSLLNDRLFCDTKLQTDTETFPAHRCVLSARSPVFKKMFTTDMKEAAGECINVPDINSDTVRRMLQFLYTDRTGDLDMQSAKDMYTVSDKYDIASLKQHCSTFIKKSLCPANVCEVLVLADMHQDKDLESAAQEYVLTYDKEVLGSEEWKLFMKKFTSLAAQVMYLKCMKE